MHAGPRRRHPAARRFSRTVPGAGEHITKIDEAEALMRERGVLASARGPALRLAPHFYSTLDDVEVALDALAEVFGVLASE